MDDYATDISINYNGTALHELIDSYIYAETSSIAIVDVKINTSTRQGWQILPLTYRVTVVVNTGIIGDKHLIELQKTTQIAIFFDRGGGQEDAGKPGDAGNDYASARSINFPGSYHGFIDAEADTIDCYSCHIDSLLGVSVSMTPPPFVNFDLEVFIPSWPGFTYRSQNGPGATDKVTFNVNRDFVRIKVYNVSGSGVYSLDIQPISLTVNTCKTTGSQITNVKVWIDCVQYYSPVTIPVQLGTRNVTVEPSFFRNEWWCYTFDHWNDGSTDNPRYLPVTDNTIITAYYTVDYLCPTLFVWNGSEYVYEALLNIHAESDITVQHQIQQTLVLDGWFYKLQLRELDNYTSHIDQVKLYAVDQNGE